MIDQIKLIWAAMELALDCNEETMDPWLNTLERFAVRHPNEAAKIASSNLDRLSKGFAQRAQSDGVDVDITVLDTHPEIWLALTQDQESRWILEARERLKIIAQFQVSNS